jgi:riboflavin kinase/FMN adenylyltransferase
MEIIRGHYNIRAHHCGCVATVGNFDGVHLGHQAVLGHVVDKARALQMPGTVITFEPQPLEYFARSRPPPRLTRFSEKMHEFERLQIDRVCVLRFNRRLAQLPAEAFIRDILVDGLGLRYLVVGDDFRFGKDRVGDFAMLEAAGSSQGFEVVNLHTITAGDTRVSSTAIRAALAGGDLERTRLLLGRAYRIRGRVAHGDRRGRTLGFPTANVHLHRKAAPVSGVYAVYLLGVGSEPVAGVANVGRRPTVGGDERILLEVHLFDFARDIYGYKVEVELVSKLREERKFVSFEALREQIWVDVRMARERLVGGPGHPAGPMASRRAPDPDQSGSAESS